MDGETTVQSSDTAAPDAVTANRDTPTPKVRVDLGSARWLLLGAGVLIACVGLYLGRDLFVPIALSVLVWFLINAVANGLAGPPEERRMPVGAATVISALIFAVLVIAAGQLVADNAAGLGRQIDLDNGAVIVRFRELYASLGLSQIIDLDELLAELPIGDHVAATVAYLRGLLSDASLVFLYVYSC